MAKKNHPAPIAEKPSADTCAKSNTFKLNPRQDRIVSELLAATSLSREQIDRIAGASNGPNVIMALRRKFGSDAISTRMVDGIDRDGKPVKTGRYSLTDVGYQRLLEAGVL